MSKNIMVGKWGEQLAANYLMLQGFVMLDKNWRGTQGEIDLVMKNEHQGIIFIEVKTRTGKNFGFPESAVTTKKRRNLIKNKRRLAYRCSINF
ncbi:MAG: YraN family protein [Anaerolineae bacterium]|nr:YraN family protein [Anaerolineae bacterium]